MTNSTSCHNEWLELNLGPRSHVSIETPTPVSHWLKAAGGRLLLEGRELCLVPERALGLGDPRTGSRTSSSFLEHTNTVRLEGWGRGRESSCYGLNHNICTFSLKGAGWRMKTLQKQNSGPWPGDCLLPLAPIKRARSCGFTVGKVPWVTLESLLKHLKGSEVQTYYNTITSLL